MHMQLSLSKADPKPHRLTVYPTINPQNERIRTGALHTACHRPAAHPLGKVMEILTCCSRTLTAAGLALLKNGRRGSRTAPSQPLALPPLPNLLTPTGNRLCSQSGALKSIWIPEAPLSRARAQGKHPSAAILKGGHQNSAYIRGAVKTVICHWGKTKFTVPFFD